MSAQKQGPIIWTAFLFLALLLVVSIPATTAEAPSVVKEAASKGLGSFLKAIPRQDFGHFNFSSVEEMREAKLGKPFRVHTIVPDRLFAYTPGMPVKDIVSPTPVWLFPVLSRGETRTLLTVDILHGQWRAVAIGSSGLARRWDSVMKLWPSSIGYKHTFVRVFQATADFVLVSDMKESKLVPLESARVSLRLSKEKTYSPSETLIRLQKNVRRNLEASRDMNNK